MQLHLPSYFLGCLAAVALALTIIQLEKLFL